MAHSFERVERDFAAVQRVVLRENYRSCSSILNTSMALMDAVEGRPRIDFFTNNDCGLAVPLLEHDSGDAEANAVAQQMLRLKYLGNGLGEGEGGEGGGGVEELRWS